MLETRDGKKVKIEFGSIHEFVDYITKTPLNDSFRWAILQSSASDRGWHGTRSFEEASDLLKYGWQDMSEKLITKLKAEGKMEPSYVSKIVYDVQGFQPIVPLYLQGIPTSMVSRKKVVVKQKVVTINKDISYPSRASVDTIMAESIKAFRIIKRLESQGYRVNLNVCLGTKRWPSSSSNCKNEQYYVGIRVKSANEKLNVSKLAFPLVNPSMLRRIFFRFIEVYPSVSKSFVGSYGYPANDNDMKREFDGITLPAFISTDIDKIKNLEDIKGLKI